MNRRHFMKLLAAWLGQYSVLRRVKASTSRPHFLLPPTTLHVEENRAQVYYWLSENNSRAILRLFEAERLVQEIPLPTDTPNPVITLENLQAATAYRYEISIDGVEPSYLDFEEKWGAVSFRTQPYEWPLRVVMLGDSGFGDNITYRLSEHMAAQDFDFFIHLGDVVYLMEEHANDWWRNWALKYYWPFRDLLRKAPHYPTVGNHDRNAPTVMEGQSFYFWAFPPLQDDEAIHGQRQWYQFKANDVRFLSLNTQSFYTDRTLSEQNLWLDAQLADTSARLTIPFFHVPLWTSGKEHVNDGAPVAQTWQYRFEAAKAQIPLVLAGHQHLYERIERGGICYVTSGGGSTSIYGHGEPVAGGKASFSLAHYVVLEIEESQISIRAYDIDNTLMDARTITI